MTAVTSRFDIYRVIHKALRACMNQSLDAVGSMDPQDDAERTAVVAQVREMLVISKGHLRKEDAFVHPAMEARSPGSSQPTTGDHAHHLHWFETLEASLTAFEQAEGEARATVAAALYRSLGLFVGENFAHMHVEETANNEVLWRTHSDAELMDMERAIVASLPAQEKFIALRWMLPAVNPAERADLLGNLRSNLPPPLFAGMVASLRQRLSDTHWKKLSAALDPPGLAA